MDGPLVFAGLLAFPFASLPGPAHRLAAILGLVVVLWITEAIPLAVTALLGPVLAILLQVAPAPKALASFADPIIFLFIGSFILAESMYVHGLDRRIAYSALSSRLIGRSAGRLLVAFGGVSVVISMWISNTATAAMTYGGAARDVTVASPGGTQRVEWRDDGLHLTGWAEVVWEGRWTR